MRLRPIGKAMSTVQDFLHFCDCCYYLFYSAMQKNNDKTEVQTILAEMLQKIDVIKNYIKADVFQVVFAGRTNVGKSTLLNALLGNMIAPVRNGPWSAAPVEYRYSPEGRYKAIVAYDSSIQINEYTFDKADELLERLKVIATAIGPGGRAQASRLIIELPYPLLKSLTIVDTPGFSATDGTEENMHDELLKNYLLTSNMHRIFWIVKDNPQADEKEFYQKYLAGCCSDIIVNTTSVLTEEQKKSWIERYRFDLSPFLQFHFVHAKLANQALLDKSKYYEAWQSSNMEEILNLIKSFATVEQRLTLAKMDIMKNLKSFSVRCFDMNNLDIKWLPLAVMQIKRALRSLEDKSYEQNIQQINLHFQEC